MTGAGFAERPGRSARAAFAGVVVALGLVAAAAESAPAAGTFPIQATVDPFTASLGERVMYRGYVIVGHGDGVDWGSPEGGGNFTWGTPRTGRVSLKARHPGGPWPADSVWVEVPLQVFVTGQVSIPGLRVAIQRELDRGMPPARPLIGRLPTARYGIAPNGRMTGPDVTLRPARGPLSAPWWEQVPWAWVLGGAALLIAIVILMRRLRRRKPVPVRAPAPIVARRRDPAAEALSELAALKRMGLLDRGLFAEHAFRLSRILRNYLEATRGALRPGDTTTELIGRLSSSGDPPADLGRLTGLLRGWDGIKFAQLPSDAATGTSCEEAVHELVVSSSRPRKEVA